MSGVPAIKGLAIAGLVEDLRALGDDAATGSELAKHLGADELALLEDGFDPFSWYPIAVYERLTAVLVQLTGNDGVDYLRARGAAAARRLLAKGLYQQLDALKKGREAWGAQNYRSHVRLIATLHGSMLNFSTWRVEGDPEHASRVRIVVSEASEYPEVLRHVTEGFVNACAEEAGGRAMWTSARAARDRIVFSMDRDI